LPLWLAGFPISVFTAVSFCGAEIVAQINSRILDQLLAPVGRVCGYDVTFPYFALEEDYLPTAERVLIEVDKVMKY